MILIIALCTCYVLINAVRNYTLRSNNCAHRLKSQFAIITCSHLNPVLLYIRRLLMVGKICGLSTVDYRKR